MRTLNELPDTCTAEEAAAAIAALAPILGIRGDLPDVRTLRLWRTKRRLTLEGRRFTRRNLLEALAIVRLQRDGLTQQRAADQIRRLDDLRLRQLFMDPASPPGPSANLDPFITLQLLASGITSLYNQVQKGAIVGHTDDIRTGTANTPLALRQAMARLGRHYFEEGCEDQAASVHLLLWQCGTPLAQWAPRALADLQEYRGAILIDSTYHVPSEDCETIAETAASTNLSDLLERQLHERLRAVTVPLGTDADLAYTAIREFVGRHPMVGERDLRQLAANPELPHESIDFVHSLYTAVHESEADAGLVRRCAHCQALISRETGACLLAGCRDDHPVTQEGAPLRVAQARLARPEVLKYWADPAREELRLYDALRRAPRLRERVSLYPHSDWCDVALGEEVGVDVKDYRDPVRLAQRLNRSIGHLDSYPVRILAVAQRRWSPIYHDLLVEHLSPIRCSALQVMSVDQAIRYLKRAYAGGQNA